MVHYTAHMACLAEQTTPVENAEQREAREKMLMTVVVCRNELQLLYVPICPLLMCLIISSAKGMSPNTCPS